MAKKFKSVGRGGTNTKRDSKLVATWLNRHIEHGSLTGIASLDPDSDGGSQSIVAAIETFQEKVLSIPPTGIVKRLSDTHVSLKKTPKNSSEEDAALDIISDKLDEEPIGGIADDLWWDGLLSMTEHLSHPRLTKYNIVTFVDFRIDKKQPRLWVVNLNKPDPLINCKVAHGSNSTQKKDDETPDVDDRYGGSKQSACGAWVTTYLDSVLAGQKDKTIGKRAPGVRLVGLDETTQKRARKGVIFHGAHYVNSWSCGNSGGCFATSWENNNRICNYIKNGTFVYSYSGMAYMPTI